MPILRLNAGPEGLGLHGSPASAAGAVRSAAQGRGPVIIMIHGFKYDPLSARYNPHASIFSGTPQANGNQRWPRHLGFGSGDPAEGLGIAFGWRARGNLWRAERAARTAGRHLARVIATLRTAQPQRPVHVVTHSMGSEVIFEALQDLPAGAVGRIVTLQGASYASRAQAALATPAGRTAELFNVISRENDLFDFLYERLMAPPARSDRAMGAGIDADNALNLAIDCADTLDGLRRFGGSLAAPARRICHWSGYTRPGALRFYAHLLRRPETTPLDTLRAALPGSHAPRWSRLVALPRLTLPLPLGQKAAS